MGLTIGGAPPSEFRPDEPLQPAPALEYYPSMGDPAIRRAPVVALSIAYRNHAAFTKSDSEIIYGDLNVEGEPASDGQGWKFTFDNVCFTKDSVDTVWSLRACVYLGGTLKDDAILTGILIVRRPGR